MAHTCPVDGNQVRRLIQQALHEAADGHGVHRLDGVLLVAEGHSVCEVAVLFAVARRTVQRWVRSAGLTEPAAWLHVGHGGRPGRLDVGLQAAVAELLSATPASLGLPDRRWNGKRLATLLQQRHGVVLSVRTCQRLIAQQRSA